MFGDSTKELLKDSGKCLDSQFWHACAGGMVQMPSVNSNVYYFPQGHAEHAVTNVDFGSVRTLALVLCRVASVMFLADCETDEIFAKIQLIPIQENDTGYGKADDHLTLHGSGPELPEKPASFAKTLTQSDANNGGGFSVPRYCAETIFPRLDYSAAPPSQHILAKDVHGEVWKFRHIYRGTPRRHLLTTGWSTFVNQKKLVAGDAIVFLRTVNGDMCVGIRRAKREMGNGMNSISGWNSPLNGRYGSAHGEYSMFLREEGSKMMMDNGNHCINSGVFASGRARGRVKAESVIEAATLSASGHAFEIFYYPRANTPEFCVKAAAVRAAMRIRWCPGMRFKMPFETEDSSRISWFMGTITSVQVADPLRWPNSPWRLLEVAWDEPDLLQNVKRVSPWLVELVSNIPSIHLTPFSPLRKKLRLPQHTDFPLDVQPHTPAIFPEKHPLGSSTRPAGIQGARHTQFGDVSLPNVHHPNKLQSGLFPARFPQFNYPSPHSWIDTGLFASKPTIHSNVNIACLLAIGTPAQDLKKSFNGKTPHFVLFGQPILTEEQISLSNSGNNSSDENPEKIAILSDGSGSAVHRSPWEDSPVYKDWPAATLGLVTPHCIEFAAELHDFVTEDLSTLYPAVCKLVKISVVEASEHILTMFDKRITKFAEEKFRRDGIEVKTGFRVVKVSDNSISMINKDKGEVSEPYGMAVWSTGIGTRPVILDFMKQISQADRRVLATDEWLRVCGCDGVYALGDCATISQRKVMDDISDIFKVADADNSGTLTVKEIKDVLNDICIRYPQVELYLKSKQMSDIIDLLKDSKGNATKESVELNIEEFKKALADVDAQVKTLPATAQVAAQQGNYLARCFNKMKDSEGNPEGPIRIRESGRHRYRPFRYKHFGQFAPLGGEQTAAQLPGDWISIGQSSQWLWYSVYASKQVSWRTRALVVSDWTRRFIFGRDSSCI